MANAKYVLGPLVGMALCAVSAQAQPPAPATEKFFANVNLGGQLTTPDPLSVTAAKTIYDETATLISSQPVGRGLVFDVGGGYRVWGDVFAGIVISRFGDTETASTTASIPDPVFFNRPKTVTGTTTGLKRSEVAIAPHAVWSMPLRDKIDVAFSGGISIIKVSQELVGSFSVAAGTQNVTTTATKEKGTAVGPYVGVDVIYNLNPMYGIGGFIRYAGGKVDLPSAVDAHVGGAQAGGGIRLRFGK